MRIVLRRKVNVFQVNVMAKIAFAQRRVAEHAVVVWVADRFAQRLSAKIADLCDSTAKGPLVGLPQTVAMRIVQVCHELGLLTRDREHINGLTAEGQRVAASREPRIFVPQLGTWSMYWSNEALLAHSLLHIEPFREPTSHDEETTRKQRARRHGAPKRNFIPTPPPVLALRDERSARPPLDLVAGGDPVRVVMIEERGELVLANRRQLLLEVTFEPGATAGTLFLRGEFDGKRVEHSLPSLRNQQHASVFFALLQVNGAHVWWNGQTGKLRATYSQLAPDHLTSFSREMQFKTPTIQRLGQFEDTIVDKIPIEPATPADAQRWFEWLLAHRADQTQWPDVYARGATELRQRFPGFQLQVPAQGDFARQMRGEERPMSAYWHLQAPLDLDGGMAR